MFAIRSRYSETRRCTSLPTSAELCPHSSSRLSSIASVSSSPDTETDFPRASVREPGDPTDPEGCVGRVAREHVRRDEGTAAPSRGRSYNQLGDLGPGEKPKRDERRAEAGRDVQDARAEAKDALDVAYPRVREVEASRPVAARRPAPRGSARRESGGTRRAGIRRAMPGKWQRRMRSAAPASASS